MCHFPLMTVPTRRWYASWSLEDDLACGMTGSATGPQPSRNCEADTSEFPRGCGRVVRDSLNFKAYRARRAFASERGRAAYLGIRCGACVAFASVGRLAPTRRSLFRVDNRGHGA